MTNRLYYRLREQHARPGREHFWADLEYQNKSARFLDMPLWGYHVVEVSRIV
jgi:hypothetical protein